MAVAFDGLAGTRSLRLFSSVWNEWQEQGRLEGDAIAAGVPLVIDAGGFALIKLQA
jgi:hypothetical protein